MKLFELNQTIGSYILEVKEFPLNISEYICIELITENKEEEIPEHYKIFFVFQEHFAFNIGDFAITILQEDLQNNIPVAYARVDVLKERTEEVIDTITYTIRFDSKTEEFKHLKDFILANITPTQNIVFGDLY